MSFKDVAEAAKVLNQVVAGVGWGVVGAVGSSHRSPEVAMLLSAAVCRVGCSALPLNSAPSSSPTLGRGVASSSHCQPVWP